MKAPAQPSPSPSSSTSQHQRIAVCGRPIFDLLCVSRNQSTADRLYLESHVLLRSNRRFCQLPSPPYATRCNPEEPIRFEYRYWNKTWNYLSFLKGVRELTLEFLGFTAGLIGDSSPLLGWIRLDANLNEILATSHDHETDMCILRDHETPMCKGMARGRPTRGKKDALGPYGRVWFSLCFR
ncbi:hypothetical protein E6C27_scaffold496G00190 [Cucumis melo var. makuwa]|uniref:Ty3-gypsy retrotransposon protein n=1 Tax=Cucumis melo var. makuwa TaxID=1194695 RepID=A0A5A7UXM3_CUCMM|nr:hypothetical protein E6C27_scaffold496G00190 [Cucumis melo var. makuwa]